MLKEISACFAISIHRYMHFLPAMKANHPFFLGGRSSSSPSAAMTRREQTTFSVLGQSYIRCQKCWGYKEVVKVLVKVVNRNTEFDECH